MARFRSNGFNSFEHARDLHKNRTIQNKHTHLRTSLAFTCSTIPMKISRMRLTVFSHSSRLCSVHLSQSVSFNVCVLWSSLDSGSSAADLGSTFRPLVEEAAAAAEAPSGHV